MQRSMAREHGIRGKSTSHRGDTVMFFGVLGVILGWFLIIGMISPTGGVAVAVAGIAAVFLGFVGKHAASLWHKLFD